SVVLGAVCTHRARLHARGKEQGLCAGRAPYRNPPGQDSVPPRAAERRRAGARHRHHQSRARNHHGGDAVVSRARPAFDPALTRNLDPDRPEISVRRRMVDCDLPRHHARRTGARREPVGRLAARRTESETAMTAVLSVRNLKVEFPTRRGILTAIDDVSFDIGPGEVLGVVGESGAGKSITGTAVIGLIEPPGRIAGGEVLLRGQRIDNLPPDEMRKIRGKRIGMVFQDPLTSLNPLYRIGDQLVETITTHTNLSNAQARAKALSLLNEVGIPAPEMRVGAYPHQFSGGMRQRVVLA